ncbi:MAG: hypothetical protein Q7R65_00550 [bacterium]|nr:hypothetical protein [bacterium]
MKRPKKIVAISLAGIVLLLFVFILSTSKNNLNISPVNSILNPEPSSSVAGPTTKGDLKTYNVYQIKELGLLFDLPQMLSGLKHRSFWSPGDQAVNSVVFTTWGLARDGVCTDDALGTLTYNKDLGGVIVAHARGSDVYYLPPQKKCDFGEPAAENWPDILETALKNTLISDFEYSSPKD